MTAPAISKVRMVGFSGHGMPTIYPGDFYQDCIEQGVPHTKGQESYFEAVCEAFPEWSRSHVHRLFKDKAVRLYGYEAPEDGKPEELFGPFDFAVGRAGKEMLVFFKGEEGGQDANRTTV